MRENVIAWVPAEILAFFIAKFMLMPSIQTYPSRRLRHLDVQKLTSHGRGCGQLGY